MTLVCPIGPDRVVDWNRLATNYDGLDQMAACPQEPEFHGEGDVLTHTKMVVDSLLDDPRWTALDEQRRVEVFTAAVLHDIGKPATTRIEDGRIRQPGHARRGEIIARVQMWQRGVPAASRERIANLIRCHLQPFHLLEYGLPTERLFRASWTCDGTDTLLLLARADAAGRISASREDLIERVDLARLLAEEHSTIDAPFDFASDHSRVHWFRRPSRDPNHPLHDDIEFEVTLMSGLPGSGKDHWVSVHAGDLPVVSLDAIRTELGVDPTKNQGPVRQAARELAKVHLRARQPFVWNATNLSRRVRSQCIDLFLAYGARVQIVAIEAPYDVIIQRNARRSRPVPDATIARMLNIWEAPDLTEAHRVTYVEHGV
jgi:predicted kinase